MQERKKRNPDKDVPPVPGREPRPIDEPDRLPDGEPSPNPDEVRDPPLRV